MLVIAFSLYFYPDAELELAEAVGWYEEQRNKLGFNFYEDYIASVANCFNPPVPFPLFSGMFVAQILESFHILFFLLLNESQS